MLEKCTEASRSNLIVLITQVAIKRVVKYVPLNVLFASQYECGCVLPDVSSAIMWHPLKPASVWLCHNRWHASGANAEEEACGGLTLGFTLGLKFHFELSCHHTDF